jgi:6-phosphogluconolactonase
MAPQIIIDAATGLGEALTAVLAREATRAFDERGRFGLALPGGSVATTFFPVIARDAGVLSDANFFWGDERAVPPDDAESNYGLARALLLDPLRVPPSRIHRMEAEADDIDAAASAYEAMMVQVLGAGGRLDVVLAGVGPDGHVCSLFPAHVLLTETQRRVAPVFDSPKLPAKRLSLTLPAIEDAGLVIVAAVGSAKASVVATALTDDQSALPVAEVTRRARRVLFLLDPSAARLVPSSHANLEVRSSTPETGSS